MERRYIRPEDAGLNDCKIVWLEENILFYDKGDGVKRRLGAVKMTKKVKEKLMSEEIYERFSRYKEEHENATITARKKTDIDGLGRTVLCGYIIICINNKSIPEHRYIMEKILNHKLKSSEIVHHKNGKKWDNRPENLELFSNNKEHLKSHWDFHNPTKRRKVRQGDFAI